MPSLTLHLAAITSELVLRATTASEPGAALRGPGIAHLAAVRARASVGVRRIWLLLPRRPWGYGDYIYMRPWVPGAVERGLPLPEAVSVISETVHRGLHLRRWEAAAGLAGGWAVTTTSLAEVEAWPPVPVWTGDAVVFAGRWRREEAAAAVRRIGLPGVVGGQPPTIVVPVVLATAGPAGRGPCPAPARDVPGPLALGVWHALHEEAARSGGTVRVTTDGTLISPFEFELIHQGLADASPPGAGHEPPRRSVGGPARRAMPAPGQDLQKGGQIGEARRRVAAVLWHRHTDLLRSHLPNELGDAQARFQGRA